jgi:hypothetical protein
VVIAVTDCDEVEASDDWCHHHHGEEHPEPVKNIFCQIILRDGAQFFSPANELAAGFQVETAKKILDPSHFNI